MTGAEVIQEWQAHWQSVGWVLSRGDFKPAMLDDLAERIDSALSKAVEEIEEAPPVTTKPKR